MKSINLKSVWERIAGSRMAGQVAETLAGAEAREALLSQTGYQGQPAGLAARLMVEVSRTLPLALDAASLRGFGAELPGAQVMAQARAEALSRYPAPKGAPQPASQLRLSPEEQAALTPWLSGQRMSRLAQAYVISGDADLARAAAKSLAGFCEHNPPLMGPGWMDEQMTAIRLVNWLWCFRFLNDPAIIEQDTVVALLIQMQVAGQMLAETLASQPAPAPLQAGPAGALLHLGRALSFLPEASGWLDMAAKSLGPALMSWSSPMGLPSSNWAAVMLEWGALSLWLCMKNNLEQPAGLVAGLRTLGPLVRAMAPPWGAGAEKLAWGWSPASSVLGLSRGRVDAATGAANLAAMLLTDPDLRAGRFMDERLYWLYGKPAYGKLRQLAGGGPPPALHLPAAGLAEISALAKGRRVSLWLRTAPQEGAPPADAAGLAQGLSMGFCLEGNAVLAPPGPPGSGPLAAYLAGRSAYSAVRVDGAEPGPGAVSLEALQEDARGAFVAASFDGYANLADPVRLRRRLFIDKTAGLLQVVDQVQAEGEHDCEVLFHLPAGAEAAQNDDGSLSLKGPWGRILMQPDNKADLSVVTGQANPPLGWQVDGMGRVQAAPVVRVYARTVGSARLVTSLVFAS